MRLVTTRNEKGVALVMAVAIMAVLAIVGFSFATSMKLENAACGAVKNMTLARLASYAALQLFQGSLAEDLVATPDGNAGAYGDHLHETLYENPIPSGQRTLLELGNLYVSAEAAPPPGYAEGNAKVRDESSKMNLNAFGNLSRWYAVDFPNSKTIGDIVDANASVYHGVNDRFSSFEVSFEEFFYFYYKSGLLWNSTWPSDLQLTSSTSDPDYTADSQEARWRCANLARAVCLYRYGADGKPGVAGADDDSDNTYYEEDNVDNDGDGTVDEGNEGIDEPDEYNPYQLKGDDQKFDSIEDLKTALRASYTLSSIPVDPGVKYDSGMTVAEQTDEADRVYDAVRNDLTVHSYTLDIRSASIDHLGYDGYDNDGDGQIDQSDVTGAVSINDAGDANRLLQQIADGKTIYGTYDAATDTFTNRIDVHERDMDNAAQAAYLYLKLKDIVPRFTLKNALDIVDYRDTNCVPTFIPQADVNALTDGAINEDLWGMEGLHVTEVGRYITVTNQFTSDDLPWAGTGTVSYTVDAAHTGEADRTSGVSLTDAALKQGDYMIKLTVTLPDDGSGKLVIKNHDGSLEREYTNTGVVWFGPLTADSATKGLIQVIANPNVDAGKTFNDIVGKTFSVSGFTVYLPYIEVMNWSRKDIAISDLYVYVGPKTGNQITDADTVRLATDHLKTPSQNPPYKAGVSPASAGYIPGQRELLNGFDAVYGGGYGYLVIAYDEHSFARNFVMNIGNDGDQDGEWGEALGEDFPLWTVDGDGTESNYMSSAQNPFYDGFDGTQQVQLLVREAANTYRLVAGGILDGFAAANGTGKTLSGANLGLERTHFFGNPWYSKFRFFAEDNWIRGVQDETAGVPVPRCSPGRWNRIDNSGCQYWWHYDPNVFQGTTHGLHDMPLIPDRGYFVSAAEVSHVSAGEHKNATFNYSTDFPDWFPEWNALIAYVVAGRSPARVNLNTAPLVVMTAASVGLSPDAASLIDVRNNNAIYRAQVLCEAGRIKNMYYDEAPALDDDGDNAKSEFSERELWLIETGAVFTLRAHVFSVVCTGAVKDPSGNLRASCGLTALFERGRALKLEGTTYKPMVIPLSIQAGSGE
jgi:hypothetical protein